MYLCSVKRVVMQCIITHGHTVIVLTAWHLLFHANIGNWHAMAATHRSNCLLFWSNNFAFTATYILCASVLQYQATDAPNNCRGLCHHYHNLLYCHWSVRLCCCFSLPQCELDVVAVAHSYVYYEKLVLMVSYSSSWHGLPDMMHWAAVSCVGKSEQTKSQVGGWWVLDARPSSSISLSDCLVLTVDVTLLMWLCWCGSVFRCMFAAGCKGLHWHQKARNQTPHWCKFLVTRA